MGQNGFPGAGSKPALEKGDKEAQQRELGDLLFAAVNLARKLGIDAEGALRSANARFKSRFEHMEARAREQGADMASMSINELDALWDEAKEAEQETDQHP